MRLKLRNRRTHASCFFVELMQMIQIAIDVANKLKTTFFGGPFASEILSFRVFPKFTAGGYVRSSR